ncbi:hypothetical protein Xcel_0398 [Xylanimonas cellulosilytica DSM 15894]|uniref:Uncharacterized protein n=1 Tax=Xylanimonas cellulosilytica (strain DSM 15894 / JCM 12276 / CECT 5975 / KCTC 9989 / LMG 20990 / NBRC 107835 / XIL07) TaxID=446471 RepID=D1BVG6_XYLCX|nr:hypothetical protein [Xylanimonas cellulosilytica]ACZ29437.1 hypothetical protein Xcel_0398 [Xylanimonas cellulosilytica DSM 15894]
MTHDQQPEARPRSEAAHGARPAAEVFRRRRILIASAAGALVLVVAVLTAFVWPGYALPEPLPTPTVTVTAPVPTPTVSPAERTGEETALTTALPDEVLQFVQRGIENLPAWQDDHQAIESWTVTYADGTGDDATTITLQVGQWSDADAAASFAGAQVKAAGTPTKEGDVLVDGEVVGTYALIPDGDDAVLWWSNATVVFRAQGPADELEAFYGEYPL